MRTEGVPHEDVVIRVPNLTLALPAKTLLADHIDLSERPRNALAQLVGGREHEARPHDLFAVVEVVLLAIRLAHPGRVAILVQIHVVLMAERRLISNLARRTARLESSDGLANRADKLCHARALQLQRQLRKVKRVA